MVYLFDHGLNRDITKRTGRCIFFLYVLIYDITAFRIDLTEKQALAADKN